MNSNPLRTLRLHRDFRRLWLSAVVSDVGTWMQVVTVSVLVATTSQSAASTALVYSALFLPQGICAPLGGLLADRFDRRHVAITVQVVQSGIAGVLALMVYRGVTSPWLPRIWPLKGAMPLACVLLLIQGVAELLRSIHAWRTGVWIGRRNPNSASDALEDKPGV